jgi:hypothetical protein
MSPALILAGTAPLAYLYMIGHRLSAHLDEERIACRGWITASEARWDEVVSVTRLSDLSSPRRLYYGPQCYEVQTEETEFIVNLLYFPPAFRSAFTGAVKQRRLLNKRGRTR